MTQRKTAAAIASAVPNTTELLIIVTAGARVRLGVVVDETTASNAMSSSA